MPWTLIGLERQIRRDLGHLPPAARASTPSRPPAARLRPRSATGDYWANPKTRPFADLLIELLPKAQVAAMEDTKATGGQYGLGIFPTGGNALIWGADTQAINTTCGRAWGHGGNLPGYLDLPISSPDGSRQAVLLVNADPILMSQTQLEQVYNVLDTAYCRGVTG